MTRRRWIWPGFALLLLLTGCQSAAPEVTASESKKPTSSVKLGVLVVFDQMRGDFPVRWRKQFGPGGFQRLQDQGAWFSDCHCPYAWTSTSPGHASISTGATPAVHGIIENGWFDRAAASPCLGPMRIVTSACQMLSTDLPPALFRGEDRGAGSAGRMLAPTIGEALKTASNGRVFSFSLKDRGAILLAGAKADGCYWFDGRTGTFATSTYYRTALHPWVTRFNRDRVADRWFGKPWNRLRDDLDYQRHSGPDDVQGEDIGYHQGRTFPHPMKGGLEAPGKDYYRALVWSPFGNDMMFELAKRAIDEEKLGQGETTDLLCLAFSSNDAVGHAWGPDSQEVLDTTLRSDKLLAELLDLLAKKVGKERFFVVVAADHGACPLLHVAKKQGKPAGAMRLGLLDRLPEDYLEKTYGVPENLRRYITIATDLNVYLDHPVIEKRGLKVNDVADKLAAWFREQPEIQAAYTAEQQRAGKPTDKIARMVQRSYHAKRSGDVAVVPKLYHPMAGWTGTNHGTPHPYDTHVTLMAMGPGVKPGERKEPASLLLAPVIMARGLGIDPPAKAEEKLPEDLFESK